MTDEHHERNERERERDVNGTPRKKGAGSNDGEGMRRSSENQREGRDEKI